MNYWSQFLQSLLLMLILFEFCFLMNYGQPAGLNPNAPEFYPQRQSFPNPSQQSQYPRHIISTVPEFPQSNQQIVSEDSKQNEALPTLPDFLYDWEKKDKIDIGNRREREEAGGSSKSADFHPQMKEDTIGNQNPVVNLNPKSEEAVSNQDTGFNDQKLIEGENPSQQASVTKIDQKIKSTLKFGSFPETTLKFGNFPEIILTSEYGKNNPIKPFDKKDQQKEQLLTVTTDKFQFSSPFKSGNEKQNDQHHLSSYKKQEQAEERKIEEAAGKHAHQNVENKSLGLGINEQIESTPTSKTSNSDITYKEKLLKGETESINKTITTNKQQKPISSSSSKEKQEHLQPFNRAAKNSIQKKQRQQHNRQSPTSSMNVIPTRFMEGRTEGANVIKTKDFGPELLEHGEIVEENKYDPSKTVQTKKELVEENNVDDEKKGQSEIINQAYQGNGETAGQSSKGKGQKNRSKPKSSKGKKAITPAERLKKEKEEKEILRKFKKVADAERFLIEKQEQVEIKKQKLVELEKQKQIEIEKLKMFDEKEKELRKKQMLQNKIRETEKTMKKRLHLPAPSTDPTITSSSVVQWHGNASGSSGSAGGGEINETINPVKVILPAPAAIFIFHSNIPDVSFLKTNKKKFNEIQDLLKELQKNLIELNKLEHNWLEGKARNHITISNDENLKKYRSSKEQLIIEGDKFKELNDEFKKLKEKIIEKNLLKEVDKIDEKEKEIANQLNVINNTKKENDKLLKLLMEKFIKMEGPETKEIKMIEIEMEKPLKNLWNLYNLVLIALNQIWNEPGFREYLGFKLPDQFIDIVYHFAALSIAQNDQYEFDNTMKLTLEKMLLHHNIYRSMNLETKVNGKLVPVYEMLNCFDELSKKMDRLVIEAEIFPEINFEYLKKLGKFVKEQVHENIREAFHFIIVGLDEVSEVGEQMALDGIKKLSLKWLPQNRKRQMDVIWVRLFIYFYQETKILNDLSQRYNEELLGKENDELIERDNDKLAEDVFDLSTDKEEEITKQLSKIYELRMDISKRFSIEIINFMVDDVFINLEHLIQSTNMLVKIEKRKNDTKSLPYLKSVYDKYWYKIYKNRFIVSLALTKIYFYGRKKNQTEDAINDIKDFTQEAQDKIQETGKIFNQIDSDKPDILDRLMEIINEIYEFLEKNKIMQRGDKYENDQDFMNSIADENPNNYYFTSLVNVLDGSDGDENEANAE